MTAFDDPGSDSIPIPIGPDLIETHRRVWRRIASPGTWWSGAGRVAIARETRRAWECPLCRARKAALSPSAVPGEHADAPPLCATAVEAVHRLVTDAGRLSRGWFETVVGEGRLSDAEYVELVGVVTSVVSLDAFQVALGRPLEPLPEPLAGEPSRRRPASARPGPDAYVPTIPAFGNTGAEADLWPRGVTANVLRALSLVPDEVRNLADLSAAHYLPTERVADPTARRDGGVLERAQIELLAGRVSALNECFY